MWWWNDFGFQILALIPKVLRIEVDVTEEYIQGFMQAELTFKYQLIFDPVTRTLMPLTPYAAGVKRKDLHFAGEYVDRQVGTTATWFKFSQFI